MPTSARQEAEQKAIDCGKFDSAKWGDVGIGPYAVIEKSSVQSQ